MTRVFIDTNVFVYALGADHPYRDHCRRLVARLGRGEIAGETSVEVLQELLHVRSRRGPGITDATARVREVLAWDLPVHDVLRADFELALELLGESSTLPVRDAIHVATARNRGIDLILSADTELDSLPGIGRIDPADAAALRKLAR